MLPSIKATGVREAFELLSGVAARTRDSGPAYQLVADDILTFEKSWWQFTYGARKDKEAGRRGRDPRYMHESGSLERAATRRGAPGQVVDAGADFAFVGITHPLARLHEADGRDVLGTPGPRTIDTMLERVGTFILTGHTTRGSNLWLN